jgi:hypothetical protein
MEKMNSRYLLAITVAGILIMISVTAHGQEAKSQSADPNEIFNSIMQTLPEDMKARVDSASVTQHSRQAGNTTAPSSFGNKGESQATVDMKQANLEKLPESVREQVRKTIQELEKEKMERMYEFKDGSTKKNGN